MTVESSLGEGLLVADTRDGETGDVSLIMAMNFTSWLVGKEYQVVQECLFFRESTSFEWVW